MKLNELLDIAIGEMKDFTTLSNPDFRLEQAEYIQSDNIWEIVVSYLVENTNKRLSPMGSLLSDFQYHRMYKKMRINDQKQIIGFYIYNNKE